MSGWYALSVGSVINRGWGGRSSWVGGHVRLPPRRWQHGSCIGCERGNGGGQGATQLPIADGDDGAHRHHLGDIARPLMCHIVVSMLLVLSFARGKVCVGG